MEFFFGHKHFHLLLLFLFFLSTAITRFSISYAMKQNSIDIPNERSSHSVPTPRGGGIAIFITFTLALLILANFNLIALPLCLALVGGGSLIALIGYCDDNFEVDLKSRISLHFLAAIWAMYCLDGFPILNLGPWQFVMGSAGFLLGVIGIVWCINLYNFMDGIDGLAASEGIFLCLTCTGILLLLNQVNVAIIMLCLTAAIAGFAVWNWPPAKIFLGDIGSGYLGFIFGTLFLSLANTTSITILVWIALFSLFIADATFTLVYRIYKRKKWYSAHREHAYQKMIQLDYSHNAITIGIFLLNLIIMLPTALCILFFPQYAPVFILITLSVLFWMWLKINDAFHSITSVSESV